MIVTDILKSRFISHSPFILTHKITSLCNARCKTCDLWKSSSEYKNDLTKEDIFKMLEDARKAGMINYTVWGGEPLLRKELPEILTFAKKNGFITSIITNGFLLKDIYTELVGIVDYVIVSIDSNDELHDEMRGVEGILERAIDGIKLSKKAKIKIIINSVINKLNLDKVDGLCELSKELGVSIVFEPMNVLPEYNEHLKPTPQELKKAFSKIIKYKKMGYKIGNSIQYLKYFTEKKRYTCHMPKCYITIDTDGDIGSCLQGVSTAWKKWGNVKEKSLKNLFESIEYKNFCKGMEKCNRCTFSCVIESSLAYSLNPFFLLDKMKNFFM
jgi:MoaA/NifB/PqqE/SkfB family radical SAM enzyme